MKTTFIPAHLSQHAAAQEAGQFSPWFNRPAPAPQRVLVDADGHTTPIRSNIVWTPADEPAVASAPLSRTERAAKFRRMIAANLAHNHGR